MNANTLLIAAINDYVSRNPYVNNIDVNSVSQYAINIIQNKPSFNPSLANDIRKACLLMDQALNSYSGNFKNSTMVQARKLVDELLRPYLKYSS